MKACVFSSTKLYKSWGNKHQLKENCRLREGTEPAVLVSWVAKVTWRILVASCRRANFRKLFERFNEDLSKLAHVAPSVNAKKPCIPWWVIKKNNFTAAVECEIYALLIGSRVSYTNVRNAAVLLYNYPFSHFTGLISKVVVNSTCNLPRFQAPFWLDGNLGREWNHLRLGP